MDIYKLCIDYALLFIVLAEEDEIIERTEQEIRQMLDEIGK